VTTTVRQLAELVQGQIEGDPELRIGAAKVIAEAQSGHITFCDNDKQAKGLAASPASASVISLSLQVTGKTFIRVKDPLTAFIRIVQHLHPPLPAYPPGVDARAAIHPTVILGPGVVIHPFVSIGEGSRIGARCQLYPGVTIGRHCVVGDDCILHPQVVLYDETTLGKRVVCHSHSVLGADGFGYRFHEGKHTKVPQLGSVEIGDDVEIGACTTIDRGTFTATRIGTGTKIDNLVMVAHNCQLGAHNIIVSQVGIAGSSSTGSYVVLAGQAGVCDHIHIGDRAVVGARAGVMTNLDGGHCYIGTPAVPDREHKRVVLSTMKLPEMRQDVLRIMKHLGLDQEKKAC